jgi:hypothetical protein
MLKVYGRSDPITNFLRDLNAQIFSHDDLDLMKQLYQEGLKLNLRDRNEMQEGERASERAGEIPLIPNITPAQR